MLGNSVRFSFIMRRTNTARTRRATKKSSIRVVNAHITENYVALKKKKYGMIKKKSTRVNDVSIVRFVR